MVVRIVIAGDQQCKLFAEITLVADHLAQNLPNFCFDRIEKISSDWQAWLNQINHKNKWHHFTSPLVWKELILKGSKPYYIGGASEFLEYCHSYYNLDKFIPLPDPKCDLIKNLTQYQKKVYHEKEVTYREEIKEELKLELNIKNEQIKNKFSICISGASHPIAFYIIPGLIETSNKEKIIVKIYLHDKECSRHFMKYVEHECSYIGGHLPGRMVKVVDKIGTALAVSDLLIILDNVPFNEEQPIGDWLNANRVLMQHLSIMINASAPRSLRIILPNIGPACFNATVLRNMINLKRNIIVATSDIGLQAVIPISEIADVPARNIFCPPVWGFVGINHLVDANTTFHVYNSFEPYLRFLKKRKSTLKVGSVTPEMRTLEYLLYYDDTLWLKVTENEKKSKKNVPQGFVPYRKALALVNLVEEWLYNKNPDNIYCAGVVCNGSFGLNFDGIFSQPSRLVNGYWVPASEYLMPRDSYVQISYLEEMANLVMKLDEGDLPPVIPTEFCTCKPKYYHTKGYYSSKFLMPPSPIPNNSSIILKGPSVTKISQTRSQLSQRSQLSSNVVKFSQ